MKKKKSFSRLQAREAERKILPAVKLLSKYMHSTTPDAPTKVFHGYCVPGGEFKDRTGRVFQLQVRAVCSKKEFVKNGQITPIIRKGAWFFKLRLISKAFIDKIFAD
jgi:hypothetical protein